MPDIVSKSASRRTATASWYSRSHSDRALIAPIYLDVQASAARAHGPPVSGDRAGGEVAGRGAHPAQEREQLGQLAGVEVEGGEDLGVEDLGGLRRHPPAL